MRKNVLAILVGALALLFMITAGSAEGDSITIIPLSSFGDPIPWDPIFGCNGDISVSWSSEGWWGCNCAQQCEGDFRFDECVDKCMGTFGGQSLVGFP